MQKNIILIVVCLLLSTVDVFAARRGSLERPFAADSVWNRKVPGDAEYVDVKEAIWGDPGQAPTRLYPDLITVCYVDKTQPLVNFRLNHGWRYPKRARGRGEVLFQRRLTVDAGSDIRVPDDGNGLYVILDKATGTADEGGGACRLCRN